MGRYFLIELGKTLGLESTGFSHTEKWLSAIGSCFGMLMCAAVTHAFTGLQIPSLLIASLGASAILLFSVPHAALSQPWPLVVGHILSAIIGVVCFQLFGAGMLSAGLAVGLSVLAMYYTRSIHPPGGATALFAVIGGPDIYNLGYEYVLCPVLLNVMVLLITAILFNGAFSWRVYPTHIYRRRIDNADKAPKAPSLSRSNLEVNNDDIEFALTKMNSFIDVTNDDIKAIIEYAHEHARTRKAVSLSFLQNKNNRGDH